MYVDEIIETRFLDEEHIVFCSNGESLKLMNIETGQVEIYYGHKDIIVCLDRFKIQKDKFRVVTGAKDMEIRMWHCNLESQRF